MCKNNKHDNIKVKKPVLELHWSAYIGLQKYYNATFK